jgi:hypothetical protein
MHVMVTASSFWSLMKLRVGNAAQAWCRVASAIKKNVPRRGTSARWRESRKRDRLRCRERHLKLNKIEWAPCPALEQLMTLDEYNEAVKQIMAEQQEIARLTAQLAMSGQANPTTPQFAQIMTRQWAVVQQMAKLNTELMLGIMTPKK